MKKDLVLLIKVIKDLIKVLPDKFGLINAWSTHLKQFFCMQQNADNLSVYLYRPFI